MRLLSESEPVARKNYGCDASVWVAEYWDDISHLKFSFTELRAIVTAKKNGWRIMKGEKHSQATVVSCEDELFSWRAITAIHDICLEHELYPEAEVC